MEVSAYFWGLKALAIYFFTQGFKAMQADDWPWKVNPAYIIQGRECLDQPSSPNTAEHSCSGCLTKTMICLLRVRCGRTCGMHIKGAVVALAQNRYRTLL